jgi:signal transduction histidine kinase
MRVAETKWYDEIAHLISLHDITERKQAQQAQERLSQQLQAKVSELEAFSYGIAHDLRSPLVSIEGFSRLLRDDMLNHDAERVQEDIRLLESGARKMQGFLNSTLEYSRSGHIIELTKDVSFGKIVKEVITEFNEQVSTIGATVSLADKFPRVCVDRTRIKQVLANLIQNSIKYRDKTVPLKIEIGYQPSEGEVVFFVRDNGTGIEESETEKVFDLFYRGSTEGEGSGVGLAVVKRIIDAHGGKIWVQEGQSGKGTTMCFTLPQ